MKHLVVIAVKNYFTPKERVLKGFFNNWGSKSNQAEAMVSEEDIEWSITRDVRKAHSFKCGMDSTKYKNNVYVDIKNIHIL